MELDKKAKKGKQNLTTQFLTSDQMYLELTFFCNFLKFFKISPYTVIDTENMQLYILQVTDNLCCEQLYANGNFIFQLSTNYLMESPTTVPGAGLWQWSAFGDSASFMRWELIWAWR